MNSKSKKSVLFNLVASLVYVFDCIVITISAIVILIVAVLLSALVPVLYPIAVISDAVFVFNYEFEYERSFKEVFESIEKNHPFTSVGSQESNIAFIVYLWSSVVWGLVLILNQ